MSFEEQIMTEHGIRPTANRILILKELLASTMPLSMSELETALETIDKSIISRTLATFKESHLIHVLEDGSESIRYEACHRHDDAEDDDDSHVHFHCEVCGRTFCFEDVLIPHVDYPEGFDVHFINYMAKGICPDCQKK